MDFLLNRYNLKRKVAELNPVTLEDFNGRMAKHEAQVKALSGEMKQPTGYCVSCCKNFGTQKALENHKQSKKHMVRIQFRPIFWPFGPGPILLRPVTFGQGQKMWGHNSLTLLSQKYFSPFC